MPETIKDFDVRVWKEGVVIYLGTENPDVFFAGLTVEQAEILASDLQRVPREAQERPQSESVSPKPPD